jgi:HEAT repeat protein
LTTSSILWLSLAALAAAIVALVGTSIAAKVLRARRAARTDATRAAHRSTVIALAGGAPPPAEPPGTETRAGADFDRAMVDILPLLAGDDRAGLLRELQRRGVVDRARKDCSARRGLRRARAAETLGRCGTASALLELGRLLYDPDPEVRIVAARALGKLGGAGATSFLLGSLGGAGALPLGVVTMALMRVGPNGLGELRRGLASPSPRAREAAAEVLGQHGASAALDELLMLLDDPDARVGRSAAAALGRIGSPRAVAPLAGLVDRGDLQTRRAAVTALGGIGSPNGVDTVGRALHATDFELSWRAARALSQMGVPGVELLRTEADGDGRTAALAREALAGTTPGRRAHPRPMAEVAR